MNLSLTSIAPYSVSLRVYDTTVLVRTDAPQVLQIFLQMYRRFIVDESETTSVTFECVALTQPVAPWWRPVIVLNNRVYMLRDSEIVSSGYFHALVLEEVFQQIRSHLLFHAGAVAYGDQGIVLVGDSTHGKSTLVLSLLQQGYQFLSDDIAALRRQDGLLCAFPRTLWIRSGTLDLLGLSHLRQEESQGLDRLILDAEEIRPHSVQSEVPLRHVFFLAAPDGAVATDNEVRIVLEHVDASLLAELRRLNGVQSLDVQAGQFSPLRLLTSNATAVVAQVRALCKEKGVLLLDITRRPVTTPSFTQQPHLLPLQGSTAAMELLRHFQPGDQSAVLQEGMDGRGTRLFLEVASLLSAVRCYRLSVGPLPQMITLIRDLVEGSDDAAVGSGL